MVSKSQQTTYIRTSLRLCDNTSCDISRFLRTRSRNLDFIPKPLPLIPLSQQYTSGQPQSTSNRRTLSQVERHGYFKSCWTTASLSNRDDPTTLRVCPLAPGLRKTVEARESNSAREGTGVGLRQRRIDHAAAELWNEVWAVWEAAC